MVAPEMFGRVLHPLNGLPEIAPDVYEAQRKKYAGWEALMEQLVPLRTRTCVASERASRKRAHSLANTGMGPVAKVIPRSESGRPMHCARVPPRRC